MSTAYPLLDLQSIPLSFSRDESEKNVLLFAKITPAVATDILKQHNYSHQRSILRRRVIELNNRMNDGTFEPKTSTIKFSVQNGNPILTDGQHRLAALIEANKSYEFPIMITDIDPNYIYPKIDRGKPRSLNDALRSSNTASLMSLSETGTRQIAVGIKMIEEGYIVAGWRPKTVSEDELIQKIVEKYKEQALHFFKMTDGLDHTRKFRGRIPTGLFLTLYTELPKTEWDKINEFIFGSGSAEGLTEGDPRRLVYALYTRAKRGGSFMQKAISRNEEIATLLTAWEYWYSKKTYKTKFKLTTLERILKLSPNVAGTAITFKIS